jgi:hypothetical protein
MPDVVAHGLGAQVQLLGHLRGRLAALEELEHLTLARGQVQVRMCVRLFDHVGDLSEHADDVLAAKHRHRADLDAHPASVRVDDRDARVCDPFTADHLARE